MAGLRAAALTKVHGPDARSGADVECIFGVVEWSQVEAVECEVEEVVLEVCRHRKVSKTRNGFVDLIADLADLLPSRCVCLSVLFDIKASGPGNSRRRWEKHIDHPCTLVYISKWH